MSNAKPRDLQAGWEIFKKSGFEATLININSELERRGHNPVSDRAYSHYRKLTRYGFERYVPMNRLDVETLRDPVWGSPIISRYKTRHASLSVAVVAIYRGDLVSIDGQTEDLGETEATVVVTKKSARELLGSDLPGFEGLHCLVHFQVQDEARSAMIEVVEPIDNAVRLTLGFLGLVPTSELTGRETLDPGTLRLTIVADDSDYFVNVVRVLHAFFEAVDSARIVCDEVLVQLDAESQYVLPPPKVDMMSKASPLVIELGTAWPPLAVFGGLVMLYVQWWKGHNQGRLVRKQGDEVSARAESISEQTRSLRLQNDLAEFRNKLIKGTSLQSFVIDAVRGSLKGSARDGDVKEERLQSLIERQLLPSIERVLGEQLEDITLETDRALATPGNPASPPNDDEAPSS